MNPGFYLLIKLIACCPWCHLGLRLFRPQQTQSVGQALRFGIIRLLLGLFFGLVIFFLAAFWGHAFGTGLPQNILTYLGAYVPVRWIEWTIMAALLTPGLLGAPHWRIFPSLRRLMVPFPRADSCVERRAAFLAPFQRFPVQ